MKKISYYHCFLLLFVSACIGQAWARSHHRCKDIEIPKISVSWSNDKKQYHLQSSHLEFYPFFGVFDKDFFDNHLLPSGPLCYRNESEKSVEGAMLDKFICKLLEEIKEKKRKYSDFKILSAKNFNRKKICGMMVLKFNDHPFILKIGIESPETFIDPYCKGLDNIWFFPMAGGINRHLTGLTRTKNLEKIKEKLALHSQYATLIDVPRKWHWVPKNQPWLKITGTHIGGQKRITTEIPSIYAIVADEIKSEETFNLFNSKQTTMALDICNYLDLWIDPHINNFMIEKDTKKIVIVDTEHFPSVVGIKEKVSFNSYTSWYLFLMGKCAKDWFFRTKSERLSTQASFYSWEEFTKLT